MQAKELMTRDVVVVRPDASVREIARVLLDHSISAVPVIDASGALVGMVSEGDLIGRVDTDRAARRDWWLGLVAAEEKSGADRVALSSDRHETAKDVMAAPVVTVTENADAREIARLLTAYRIKRVPVVRDGRVVGIVSRGDLLRALAAAPSAAPSDADTPSPHGILSAAIAGLDRRFRHPKPESAPAPGQSKPAEAPGETKVNAADFRALVADHEREELHHREEHRREAADRRKAMVQHLVDEHIEDEGWRGLLHRAREAAEHGKKEMLLLRFPSQLCSDGGRAINAPEPDWPTTLRGEAAELYLRWEHDLKPRGFHLTAQVLDFPGGVPGDIGLFLVWGS